ncbi:carbohydrate-binding protein [Flagellimonas sp.]|uniref:carbohydrate-binding protein n=1 Tax=Flagellimonas sp. TaxID=2058762 RepID=UPI003BAC0499
MKNYKTINFRSIFLLSLACTLMMGCEREFSEDVEFASFPPNGDVFLDTFSAGLNYFPFVDAGADPEAFSVDTDEAFEGEASMRFDVPAFGNGFVGAAFNTTARRDLSGFDALTFYAKASQAASINSIGYGISGETNNKFQVTANNLNVSTRWEKYVIPIPDPSKLINETGLFWLSEGASFEGDEGGYVLWLDEVKFEKLGTVAQPRPAILDGADVEQEGFLGIPLQIGGLTQTFNTASGNVTVLAQPSYFDFESSNNSVATVNGLGTVSIIGRGEATISATLANVAASGSLSLTVENSFDFAPTPPERDPADVISIFSEAYTNVAVDYFNGFFTPDGQTTQGGAPPLDLNGDRIINYTDLNFVGIGFFDEVAPINATEMTTLHVDIKVNESLQPGDFIRLQLLNAVGSGNETSGSVTFNADTFTTNQWVSLDIPLADFTGLGNRTQLGLLFFITDSTVSNIFVDNIYFYR